MTRFAGITLAGLLAIGLFACRERPPESLTRTRQPIAVTVAPAAVVETAERLEAGGLVSAETSAALSSRIVAAILAVHVRAGDRVRADEVVVTLDARDVSEHTRQARAAAHAAEKALTQARSAQTAADAELQLAAAWQKRITALHARKSATDQERDEAEARLAAATARAAGAQAGIELADATLASTRAAARVAATTESFAELRAPFDGLVTERMTDPGNLAAPGLPLLRIESGAARHVAVRVDEARAARLRPGDRVAVGLETPDDPAEDTDVEGVVTEVARAVGIDPRAYTVKVTLPPTVTVRTGTFARVVFRGAVRRALLVPATAIQRRGQVTSVFVVRDGLALVRLVQAGPPESTGIEILSGLEPGELVIASPPPGLADGSAVTPLGAGTPPGDVR